MKITLTIIAPLSLLAFLSVVLGGGGSSSTVTNTTPTTVLLSTTASPFFSRISQTSVAIEKPVAPEKNPPGDIPDNQVFVTYRSTSGSYRLEVPEGWARQTNGSNVSFTDKFNGVQIAIASAATAPTAKTAKTQQIPNLEQSGGTVQIINVKNVQLPSGKAVLIDYTSNSKPDAVTGKQIRLENNSYLFFKNGKLATLRLFSPQGADNVDQWQRISRSFRWS